MHLINAQTDINDINININMILMILNLMILLKFLQKFENVV